MRHRFWASSGALCTDLLSVVCRSDRPSGGVVSSEHRGFLSRTRAPRAGGGIDWVATLTEPWAFSASSRGRWGAELAISGGLGSLPRGTGLPPRGAGAVLGSTRGGRGILVCILRSFRVYLGWALYGSRVRSCTAPTGLLLGVVSSQRHTERPYPRCQGGFSYFRERERRPWTHSYLAPPDLRGEY